MRCTRFSQPKVHVLMQSSTFFTPLDVSMSDVMQFLLQQNLPLNKRIV